MCSEGVKASSICTSHFVELYKQLSVTLQQVEQMFLCSTDQNFAEQSDPKLLQDCDPYKNNFPRVWSGYMLAS